MKTVKYIVFGMLLCLATVCISFVSPVAEAQAAGWTTVAPMTTVRAGHSSILLPNGKILVVGGCNSYANPLTSAELFDPATNSWSSAGDTSIPRDGSTATVLPNGKVLVVGGDETVASADLYDPVKNTWAPAATPHSARGGHTATLLKNGKVLIVGGLNANPSVEIYDPASDAWTVAASVTGARSRFTSTLLQNGKVLVTSGESASLSPPQASTTPPQLYDPESDSWTQAGTMNLYRSLYQATLLKDGRVLVVGGFGGVSSCEAYNPVTNSWSTVASLNTGRSHFTMVELANGKLMVVGGYANGTFPKTTEIYDPILNTWSYGNSINTSRHFSTTIQLQDGRVMIAGGESSTNVYTATAEILDPAAPSVSSAATMSALREQQVSVMLPNGNILVAGGYKMNPNSVIGTAEIYHSDTDSWSSAGSLSVARCYHTGTLLPDSNVIVVGGSTDGVNTSVATVDVYDSVSKTWKTGPSLPVAKAGHTTTLLPNGKLLVVGGTNGGTQQTSVYLYDPASGTWTPAASLQEARAFHTATLLQNGKVLITGGMTGPNPQAGTPKATVEIYDPATDSWTYASSMANARHRHSATMLMNGKVIITSCGDFAVTVAELYYPAGNTWSSAGSMSGARNGSQTLTLPNGKVVVVGGANSPGTGLTTIEQYNPLTNSWAVSGNISQGRYFQSTNLLPNGKILIAGGSNLSSVSLNSSELYDTGLGYKDEWRPTIADVSTLSLNSAFYLVGRGFTGYNNAEASGGSYNNSATNYPLVQLRRIDNGQTKWLDMDTFTSGGYSSLPVTDFPTGPAMVTAFVNGIPSVSQYVLVSNPGSPYAIISSVIGGNGTITCGSPITEGGTATCTIAAADHYHLADLTDNSADKLGSVSSNTYTISNVTADHSISGTFALNSYAVAFATSGTGSLTGQTSQTVDYGSATTSVTAVPGFGKHFVNWTGTGGFVTSTSNPLVVSNVTAGMTITANFIDNPITLSTSEYATSAKITANLSYPNVNQMQFSFGGKWTAWETYVTSKPLTLPSGDGLKTVYVRFKNGTTISNVYSDTVILDSKAPVGSLVINDGSKATNSRNVTLSMTVIDNGSGLDSMSFSEDGTNWGGWKPFDTEYAFAITTDNDGTKKVYARFQDVSGNISKPVTASIVLDTVAPVGTVKINGGKLTSATPLVTLSLVAKTAVSMQISLDGGKTWGNWEPYTTSKKVTLSSGDQTVEARFMDLAGNVSGEATANITIQ